MRLLIISRTAWDVSGSFGNTFDNLFGGMDDVEVYNICCQSGILNSSHVRSAYQMTDFSVLYSLFGKRPGALMDFTEQNSSQPPQTFAPRKRRTIYFMVRDLMWTLGRWFNSDIQDFINTINPDIIYLPIYSSWYMCDVQRKIIEYCNVPCVGHITDDVYSYPPQKWSQPLACFYRFILRRKIRSLVKKVKYVEVFADNMANEYSRIFNKPFFVIGKGINVSEFNLECREIANSSPLTFVYTGNLGGGRYRQLSRLGKAIDQIIGDSAKLHIYTQTNIDDDIAKSFNGIQSIIIHGSIPASKVYNVQSEADFLVHVEDFSKQAIYETRMSFSTKIIDYMLTGKPILAIGPSEVCSISTLIKTGSAVVATCDEEIRSAITGIALGTFNYAELRSNCIKYIKEKRNKKIIQEEMKNRLISLV